MPKLRNAHEERLASGTYSLYTGYSAGYNSSYALGPDGGRAAAYWFMTPPPGKVFTRAPKGMKVNSLRLGESDDGKHRLLCFVTFEQAITYARERLGVTGWRWVGGTHKQIWLADGANPNPRACEVQITNGQRWVEFSLCPKPVVEDGMCKAHAGQARRRAEKVEASRVHREGADAVNQASADWAAKLADEFGLTAEREYTSIFDDKRKSPPKLRVRLEPESAYAILTAAAGLLRDVGVEWDEVLSESLQPRRKDNPE